MNISELYRGKRIDTGLWIEGYIIRSATYTFITIDSLYKEYREYWTLYEVEEETISKCSGMYDKNHIPIYAGDICSNGVDNFIVVYNGTSFILIDLSNNLGVEFTKNLTETLEVIGNNVDNPEMVSDFCKCFFKPKSQNEEIQIGDYVRITNRCENSFNYYTKWVEKNAPKYLERFENMGGKYTNPFDWRRDKYVSYIDRPYKVVAIAPHESDDSKILYLITDYNEENVFLLKRNGLYKV